MILNVFGMAAMVPMAFLHQSIAYEKNAWYSFNKSYSNNLQYLNGFSCHSNEIIISAISYVIYLIYVFAEFGILEILLTDQTAKEKNRIQN